MIAEHREAWPSMLSGRWERSERDSKYARTVMNETKRLLMRFMLRAVMPPPVVLYSQLLPNPFKATITILH